MAELLKGVPVAKALAEETAQLVAELKEKGVETTLAILRVGEKEDDISYERGASKRCAAAGILVRSVVLPADVDKETFYAALHELNEDPSVHGILMFRPLPKYLDNERARNAIAPEKDVDGCCDAALASVFTHSSTGFAPCTAAAAIRILDHYGIDVCGKNVTVLGRSLVVGRPLAMLLMHRNATVTICHTRTVDTPAIARRADILVSCIGHMETITKEYVSPGQTVIDVGISWNDAKGKLCGDCLFEEVEPVVKAITPVPGGVGSVTTAVLVHHVALAAQKAVNG